MEDTRQLTLSFGRRTYPEVRAVWGARLIWPNDFLSDRQDLDAHDDESKEELIHWLDNGAIREMRLALNEPYGLGFRAPGVNFDTDILIFEDEQGKIIGSEQGSSGYVYVCAWLHNHVIEGDS